MADTYPPPPPYSYQDQVASSQGTPSPITSQWAVWSMICSATGMVTSGLVAIPGVVFGHVALREIRRHPWMKGKGLAVAGLIIGYLVIAFWILFFIVIAMLISADGPSD